MKTKAVLALLGSVILFTACNKNFQGINFNFLDRKKLEVRQFDFEYLSAKARFSFTDSTNEVKATANFRIRKDSLIWFSFASGVGIEGARGVVTPDTVIIIDRVNKEYMTYDFDSFSQRFGYPIDFGMLQNLILGNLLKERKSEDEVSRREEQFDLLQKREHILIKSSVSRTTLKIEDVLISEKDSPNQMKVKYDRFGLVGEHAFPYLTSVDLLIEDGNGGTKASHAELEYSKVEEEDDKLKFPFKIPSRYTLIEGK